MENLRDIEVFNIEITEQGTFAYISFQDLNNKDSLTGGGYNHIKVPVNLRPFRLSSRDNILVDQSVKNSVPQIS